MKPNLQSVNAENIGVEDPFTSLDNLRLTLCSIRFS